MREQLYVALDMLGGLPPEIMNSVAEQVVSGLTLVVNGHTDVIRSQTEWALVFALIRATATHSEAGKLSFELLSSLTSGERATTVVSLENFGGFVATLDEFANAAGGAVEAQNTQKRRHASSAPTLEPIVERGMKAVDLLAGLKAQVPRLLASQPGAIQPAWRRIALPLLSVLGRQSTSPCREVRQRSISHLQRILMGPSIVSHGDDATLVDEVFNRVIFPLLDDLLKLHIFQRDAQGMTLTRLHACGLLCNVFMQLAIRPSEQAVDLRVLWIQILDLLDRLMSIDRKGQLYEEVPERLKNVLLVMHASGFLVPSPPGEDLRNALQRSLWAATHERVERFLPGFLDEVIAPLDSQPPPPLPMDIASPIAPSPAMTQA